MNLRHVCSFPECKTSDEHVNAKMKCSACLVVRYCDKVCQKADWARHKDTCMKYRKSTQGVDKEFRAHKRWLRKLLQKNSNQIVELTHLYVDVEKREGGLFTDVTDELLDAGIHAVVWWDFDQMEEAGFADPKSIELMRQAFSNGNWIYGVSLKGKFIDATPYKLG